MGMGTAARELSRKSKQEERKFKGRYPEPGHPGADPVGTRLAYVCN